MSSLASIDCGENATVSNATWVFSCDEDVLDMVSLSYFALAFVSLIILIALSRRIHYKTPRKDCCWGHPGTLIPLNMLDGYEFRLAYSAAFGSMTYELVTTLWNPYGRFSGVGYLFAGTGLPEAFPIIRIVVLLMQVTLLTITNYPIFFSLAHEFRLVGSLVGLVLSAYRFVEFIYISTCVDTEYDILQLEGKKYVLPIMIWPVVCCSLILICQFAYTLVMCVRKRKFGRWTSEKNVVAMEHHFEHVRILLSREPLPWTEPDLSQLSKLHPRKLYANLRCRSIPGFKYPTRVLATFTVMTIAVYMIGTQVFLYVYYWVNLIRRITLCGGLSGLLPFGISEYILPYVERLLHYLKVTADLWSGSLAVVLLLYIFYLYHMAITYRKYTHRIYQGKRRVFPSFWVREPHHSQVAAASRHAGLQIAYTIWGMILIQICIFLALFALVFVIIIPPLDYQYYGILWWLSQTVVFVLILNQIILIAQKLIVRYFFLQNKLEPEHSRPPLNIDNRRAWFNMSFFFFFYSLFLGLISALLRLLRGVIFGIFLIPRIDRPVLMKGFESMDNGFYAYLSLLNVMNAHDHPVLKCFIQILADQVKLKKAAASKLEDTEMGKINVMASDAVRADNSKNTTGIANDVAQSKRARYYWFLAYTLIHNPDLLAYRKVEVEETNPNGDNKLIKHKIVLAMHKKKQGETTSNLYITEDDSVVAIS